MIGEKILTNSGYMYGAGRYPAGKLGDGLAQMELQPKDFIPISYAC